ncbi:VanZ family protein [Sinorhizobium numidicum]|uniref:VanZ family protein n=1 Tax=Sinorhizobium numidicum TaxID=680248 RepID=A0ABY8CTY4_9HYPH|nr:VanZ family protein [Sinorhizobium numidicum]WEX74934.1 VanZ family protein [Sinorhizobium numidicum]WEX80927.1 VanZ family protein [Sinorhizobium numidicum]
MNFKLAASILAWLLLGLIAYSTLSPLDMRPRMGAWVHVERFGAFGLLGLLFATAYPRRFLLVLAVVMATAIGLELLQMLSTDRHARLVDIAVKAIGGACGVVAGWFVTYSRHRFRHAMAWVNQNANYRR